MLGNCKFCPNIAAHQTIPSVLVYKWKYILIVMERCKKDSNH